MVTARPNSIRRNGGGRPPKFDEPSRPITITLPENVLRGLETIGPDRAQAITKLTREAMRGAGEPLVEIVEVGETTGILMIAPCASLRRIPFLHLVEVAPGRFLLALDPGNDFKALEIAARDVLDELPEEDERDRELLVQLLEQVRGLRKAARVRMAAILVVTLENKNGTDGAGHAAGRGTLRGGLEDEELHGR